MLDVGLPTGQALAKRRATGVSTASFASSQPHLWQEEASRAHGRGRCGIDAAAALRVAP